jgi:hypothetical protein
MNISVLSVEYPGYSHYPSRPGCKESQLYSDALEVFDYLTTECNI